MRPTLKLGARRKCRIQKKNCDKSEELTKKRFPSEIEKVDKNMGTSLQLKTGSPLSIVSGHFYCSVLKKIDRRGGA